MSKFKVGDKVMFKDLVSGDGVVSVVRGSVISDGYPSPLYIVSEDDGFRRFAAYENELEHLS